MLYVSILLIQSFICFFTGICDKNIHSGNIQSAQHLSMDREDVPKSFLLMYEKATGANLPAFEMIKGSKKMEILVDNLEQTFNLPDLLKIRFTSKDGQGPSYENGEVIVPYEFFNYYLNFVIASGFGETGQEKLNSVINLLQYAIIHEVSHALVEIVDVPYLGKQEDVVNAVTVVLAAKFDMDYTIMMADEIFSHAEKLKSKGVAQDAFWSEHSVNRESMDHLLCLLRGSNEGANKSLFADVNNSATAKSECSMHYERVNENWSRVFSPALR